MTIESATYISDLVAANPGATDLKAEGDDHLRLLKSTIKTTFPNVTGAVTATHAQMNYLVGVTSAIQTQINAIPGSVSPTFTGNVGVGASATARLQLLSSGSATSTPSNISQLTGSFRINGSVSNTSYDAISYQSGGGGGAAVVFSRDASNGTAVQIYTNPSANAVAGAITPIVTFGSDGSTTFAGTVNGVTWGAVTGKPTNVSAFTNDAGYVTAIGAAAAGSLTGSTLASNVTGSSLSGLGNNVSATGTFSTTGLIYGRAGAGVGLGRITTTTTTGTPAGTSPGDLVLVY